MSWTVSLHLSLPFEVASDSVCCCYGIPAVDSQRQTAIGRTAIGVGMKWGPVVAMQEDGSDPIVGTMTVTGTGGTMQVVFLVAA